MLEILNLMVHQSLGNLREKKNLICSSVNPIFGKFLLLKHMIGIEGRSLSQGSGSIG